MQTHSFIADSAQAAVEQIRQELGPNAVVLSVRKLPRSGLSRLVRKDQIEVVASVDSPALDLLDEAPNSVSRLQDEVQSLKHQFAAMRLAQAFPVEKPGRSGPPGRTAVEFLAESGILPELCERVLGEVSSPPEPGPISRQSLERLLQGKWRALPALPDTAAHIYVGTPGSGKSTVLCKMLAHTALVQRQPANVYQLDTQFANSAGQVAIFAEIVGAHFERTLPWSGDRKQESVFVDLPGVALGDERGLAAVSSVISSFSAPQVHLVLNAAYDANHLLKQASFFSKLGITDLIVTHLDEENRWGKVWNLVLGTNFGLRYLSAGQNVPGDLLIATAELILARQFREK